MPADGTPAPPQAFYRSKDVAGFRLSRLLLRRVWLPTGLYRAVPWVYLILGGACLASALLLPGSEWLLPYVMLLGLGCLHAGYAVAGIRHRTRRTQSDQQADRGPFC